MLLPLHATGHAGLDPLAVVFGALAGLAIWQAIRLLARSDTRKRGGA
ncbi:hypothetical protein M0R89_19980 (plasmid) [Halorussus limi]|uniref:Uncharacterized protein n=1 Tax=Halorussus limi TaxID=2938695 RepID=A0A8U0I094_9EURY|nr:hypothetical protein [Halorussus limi]UPV76443.1 hypothetical protein M0R89_19980 [Halorussus limi]